MRRRTSRELAAALTVVPILAAAAHYEDHIAALTSRMAADPMSRDVWNTALTLAANDLILVAASVREHFPSVKTVALAVDGEPGRVVRVTAINDLATGDAELRASLAAHVDGFLTSTTKVVLQHTGDGQSERLNLKGLASKVSGRLADGSRVRASVPVPVLEQATASVPSPAVAAA